MKKLRIIVLLLILAFSFSVKAEVSFEIDCDSTNISSDKTVTCNGDLVYEAEGVTDISMNYSTNLGIKFSQVNGFTITNNNGKVTIHTDTPLSDEIMNSKTIMKFTLSVSDNSKDEEKLTFSNIKANNYEDSIDDVIETFKVTKVKEEVKSNVCTLDSITIDNTKIANFDKNVFEYNIKVTNEKIFIDAVRSNEKSSAVNLGYVRVPNGEMIERDIVVEAEDGTKNTYKLFITNTTPKSTATPSPTPVIETKEELPDEKENVKSSDNTLKILEIYDNKKKIDFKFDSKKEKYDIEVNDVKKITIKATLNDSKATFVNSFGPRDVTLDTIDNEVLVKIKAENGDIKSYQLNIHVNKKSSDNTLKSLKINDKVIDLNNEKYEVKLVNTISKTKIEAVANNDKATVKYEDIDLVVGDNKVIITVTSEDGTKKEYNINVIREEEKADEKEEIIEKEIETFTDNEPSNKDTFFYIVITIVIVIVILEIIYIFKKDEKDQEIIIEVI